MSRIRIERVCVAEVEAFARRASEGLAPDAIAPVSRIRARAWARNPDGRPDDTALLVAWSDQRCLGYLGLMPGRVEVDGELERVDWTSTFHVPLEHRSSGVGALLAMQALRLEQSLAVAAPSAEAEQLFSKLGFQPLPGVSYLELDLQAANLPVRALRRVVRVVSPDRAQALEERGGAGLGGVRSALYRTLLRGAAGSPGVRRIGADELPESCTGRRPGAHFVRGRDTVAWMLSTPWVTTSRSESTPNHYFDDHRDRSEHALYEIAPPTNGGPRSFAVLWTSRFRGRTDVQVLDVHLAHPSARLALTRLALQTALDAHADRICLPESCEPELRRSALGRRVFRMSTRRCLARFKPGSLAAESGSRMVVAYADGDLAFA